MQVRISYKLPELVFSISLSFSAEKGNISSCDLELWPMIFNAESDHMVKYTMADIYTVIHN